MAMTGGSRIRRLTWLMSSPIPLLAAGCRHSGGDGSEPQVATLATLDVSGLEIDPSFDPVETDYRGSVSYFTATIAVSAVPTDPAATVLIDGVEVEAGVEMSISLGDGPDAIEIAVANGDAQMTYTPTVDRAQLQATPAISATPQLRDHAVATSMDADGEVLFAGTPFDSGNARGVDACRSISP